jgi:benzoylformate decarboxylase
MYSIQALWTAAAYKLPVVFVIYNNQGYMILKRGLLARRGPSAERNFYTGMDIDNPPIDFVQLAQSMGVAAQRVSQADELRPAFEWALKTVAGAQPRPRLLDVTIVRDVREWQEISRAAQESGGSH